MMSDTTNESLPALNRREEEILSLIVRAYTEKPEPVSSKHLVEKYDLSISSATVRNVMAHLEETGYIIAPHTSAGRIPTAQGYRYFVRGLMQEETLLSPSERHIIETKFSDLPQVLEQWLRQAATVLARTSQSASLVTPPISQTNRFKHIELIALQGRLTLMVLVLQGGTLHQRMLNLAEPVAQAQLSDVAERINQMCMDLTSAQIRLKSTQMPLLEREVMELAADLMGRQDTQLRTVYRDGLSHIISDFQDSEGAQQAVRVFEERAFLDMILTEIVHPLMDNSDIQVVIAGDGRYDELNQLSLVVTRYGVPGGVSGALGILGPTHLNYGRAINAVRYVSGMMSGMLGDLYAISDDADDKNLLGTEQSTDGDKEP
jgi:heat-inducible transcriptional repressor